MSEIEGRLQALFAEDLPPKADPVFTASVMEQVARRRFVGEMAALSGSTVLGGLALWALWPHLAPALSMLSQSLAPLAAATALGIGAVMLLGGRFETMFAQET